MSKENKKCFIGLLEALKKQMSIDNKCHDAFRMILPESSGTWYNNSVLTDAVINALVALSGDKDKDDWILYFVYDLNFGAKYKEGMVKDKDGSIINISTESKLYDFILSL